MTRRSIRALGVPGIALSLLGIVLAIYLVHEAWLDREHDQRVTAALKRDLDIKQRWATHHDEFAVQLKEMRDELPQIEQRLPDAFDVPAIEKDLDEKATLAGVEITAVDVRDERVRDGFYADRPLDLVVRGSVAAFVKFMDSMREGSPIRQVRAMKIQMNDSRATLRADVTVHYYRYVDE